MMILKVDRGKITVTLEEKTVHIPGEMFFPPDNKIGFAIDLKNLKHWDFPDQDLELTQGEIDEILHEIQDEFIKGGHSLVIEQRCR